MHRMAVFSVLLFVPGCGSSAPASFPDCEAIAEACHEVDPGTGPLHECHENAETATSNATCASARASCIAMCEAAATTDAGATDAGATLDTGADAH